MSHDPFDITTDPARVDPRHVRALLDQSHWAAGIPLHTVERSMEHSIFAAAIDRANARTVAFARVVTDRATFAYLCDVIVDEAYRGRGLSVRMLDALDAHPDLQNLRRWLLMTRDAEALYERRGWSRLPAHAICMQRHDPQIYSRPPA